MKLSEKLDYGKKKEKIKKEVKCQNYDDTKLFNLNDFNVHCPCLCLLGLLKLQKSDQTLDRAVE